MIHKKRIKDIEGYLFVAPAMLFLLLVSIYPLLDVIILSFTRIKDGERLFAGLSHYVDLLSDIWFWKALWTTFIFTTASTILHLLIGLGIALLLNSDWKSNGLRNFFRGLLILPWVFSTAASALMWALLMHPFGLVNYITMSVFNLDKPIEFLSSTASALTVLIVVNTWKYYPFYMISILGALQSIPTSLYDAAKVDGAGSWQQFWRITIPQIKGVLIVISTFDIITTFGHIDFINMLTRGGPYRTTETISYYIYKTAFLDGHMGYGAAISVVMLVMLTFLTIGYLKLVRKED